MIRLDVDFKTHRKPGWTAWGAAAAALGLCIGMTTLWALALNQNAELSDRSEALGQQVAAMVSKPHAPSKPQPYDASARALMAQVAMPWADGLTALESVAVFGVTPVTIDVLPAEHKVRVELEFADYASLLSYLDQLNAGEPQQRWRLLQAQAPLAQSAQQAPTAAPAGVTATVVSEW
jgi:hypothetical protein